ncbi:hypothetical protein [Paenibacillus sp.]|uniref:hypothetical protein n=1 Tax=Paenibacillus sp. TaxID=58172 RepID=UPI002D5C97A1|nr:hypothetical protein [Paenibacillus sp.]HZG87305.1 hypothetical protein [Paenibacillus sp.]
MRASKFIAREPFQGTGDAVFDFDEVMESLFIINDGSTVLTVTTCSFVDGKEREIFSVPLHGNEKFDEILHPFNRVKITGSSSYRGWPRMEVVGA